MNSMAVLRRCCRISLLCSSTSIRPQQWTRTTPESSRPSSFLRFLFWFPIKPTSPFSSSATLRFLNTSSSYNEKNCDGGDDDDDEDPDEDEMLEDGETTDGWEEEEDVEPEFGDGGDGGGVVLGDVPWGEKVLSVAREVLLNFSDMNLYAFKVSPRGYIYVRMDKLSDKYGCPSMEELESYSCLYKKKVEEMGQSGDIPDDLGLEVSSPGAERLLKVPDDLDRFKDMPVRVCYVEGIAPKCQQKDGLFLLESIETDAEHCVWKLADVKENRGFLGKGRPLSRKQKDWRLRLPFAMMRRVTLYIEY
ncbi:uncharacterized protein LOC122669736 [Telopea speciosissima]|uniref:uncharacterized protein LOC122669736 n=1 Tax=Telopea speciosissima TaxID=54955 RepID=UPI001CC3B4AB|nr:uncharacterized protein LOC122669736 [Telopea speciosissima]